VRASTSSRLLSALLAAALLAVIGLQAASAGTEKEKVYYGIEINGTLCGYAEFDLSPLEKDAGKLVLVKEQVFIMLTALGMEFDSRVKLTYHVDPATGMFAYHDSDVKQGHIEMGSTVHVHGDTIRFKSTLSEDEKLIPISPGVLLENTLLFPHLIRDFVKRGMEQNTYDFFNVRDAEVQKTTYTKVGTEKIKLAGKKYEALVLDQVQHKTSLKIKWWIDIESGRMLKSIPIGNRVIYLAKPSIVKKIETANLDELILSKVDVAIADFTGITYLKAKAVIEPVGLVVTPSGLNVPGQAFTGTVVDNLIDGIFEIEHARYDGSNALPFPPDFSGDETLKEYLEPDEFIESSDPVLVKEARAITEGSKDSWEAARRLSEWVAENIGYAIPGGGTARRTYDIKAGECGAHSMLLASFCRAVGIPARVVWGCMYTPNSGGSFGQHGWNEIYMGDAGWIPVDATVSEIDYVDSGHIRIGVMESSTIAFNPREMDILDYRVGSGGAGGDEAAALEKYEPYVGEYEGPRGRTMKLLVKDNSLTLDIPGSVVLAFGDPNDEGKWICKGAPHVFLTFSKDDDGKIAEMMIHEMVSMLKKSDPDDIDSEVPEEYRSYLGIYHFAALRADFKVLYQDGGLAVYDPLEKHTVKLQPPDENGWHMDEFDKNAISFERDAEGNVTTLKIDSMSRIHRK
jgi:hypothetical protein